MRGPLRQAATVCPMGSPPSLYSTASWHTGYAPYPGPGLEVADRSGLYAEIFNVMLSNYLVEAGDLVIFTKGDLEGVSGNTNAMKILQVTAAE